MKFHILFSKLLLIFCVVFCFSSCEEAVFVTDISEQEVILIAPSEGATLDFTSINFNWAPVPEAIQYQLEIATPDFDNPDQILLDVLLDSVTQYDMVLTPNQYQWRINALNSAYQTNYTTASFQVLNNDNFPANFVDLISPIDNLEINSATITLQWSEVQDATLYRIQIIDSQSGLVVDELTTTINSMDYTFLEGNFIWQVRAERDSETTLYNERSILIDLTIPNTPSLLTPENEAVFSNTTVNFTWERSPVAGSNEIDSLYIYQDENLSELIEKQQVDSSYDTTLDVNTSYYWIMKAFDTAGNQSDNSTIFSFTIN